MVKCSWILWERRGTKIMLFKKRKKQVEKRSFDRALLEPVIRVSICTGEKTAGFKNKETGKFQEIMLVNSEEALGEFLDTYDLRADQVQKEY